MSGTQEGPLQWLLRLESRAFIARAIEDAKLLIEIKQSYEDSQGIYGSPRVHRDLREAAFKCSEKRVATNASSQA